MSKVYFKNLNGLRFIAAMMVLIPHIEQIKSLMGLNNFFQYFPYELAKLGVVLFFVLSGFLITYLLLQEKNDFKNISVRHFYIRRVLRIWPVYYLLAIAGLFIFPNLSFLDYGGYTASNLSVSNSMLYILLLPNLAIMTPLIAQLWSVGVEEQFYIIWPILIKKVNNYSALLLTVIALYLVAYFAVVFNYNEESTFMKLAFQFIEWFKIDCMAIGGYFALLLYNKNKSLSIFYNRFAQITWYLIIAVLVILNIKIPYLHFEIFAILFGIVILNLSSNAKSILNLENKPLMYLGKISYGIYMYHIIAIVLSLKILEIFEYQNMVVQYLLSLLITLCISHISYHYLESYFIGGKRKYSKIISGENAIHVE